MARLKNVTQAEIIDVAGNPLIDDIRDLSNRIEKGYCDTISSPVDKAASILALSRSAADLAAMILMKARMQEQAAEIEDLMKRPSHPKP